MESRSHPRDATPLQRSRDLRRNSTEAEKRLWGALRNRRLAGVKFRRQVIIDAFIVDFCCRSQKLVIEIDGGQHCEQSIYDDARTRAIERLGYRVIRFWNNDVLANIDAVLNAIAEELEGAAPSPG